MSAMRQDVFRAGTTQLEDGAREGDALGSPAGHPSDAAGRIATSGSPGGSESESDSRRSRSSRVWATATGVLLLAVLSGAWLGSDLDLIDAGDVIGALVVVVLALLVPERRIGVRALLPILAFAAFAGAWGFGQYDGRRAYDECMANGDDVRVLVLDYMQKTGGYPASLRNLDERVPCRRVLRGTILHYTRTPTGFDLYFGDWLGSCHATERHPFGCRK